MGGEDTVTQKHPSKAGGTQQKRCQAHDCVSAPHLCFVLPQMTRLSEKLIVNFLRKISRVCGRAKQMEKHLDAGSWRDNNIAVLNCYGNSYDSGAARILFT